MEKKTIGKLGALLGAIALLADSDYSQPVAIKRQQKGKRKRRQTQSQHIPKGCREFTFSNTEGFVVFKCVAINEANAKRKFEKFLNHGKKP